MEDSYPTAEEKTRKKMRDSRGALPFSVEQFSLWSLFLAAKALPVASKIHKLTPATAKEPLLYF